MILSTLGASWVEVAGVVCSHPVQDHPGITKVHLKLGGWCELLIDKGLSATPELISIPGPRSLT